MNMASQVKHLNSEVADAKLKSVMRCIRKQWRAEKRERQRRIVKTIDRLRSCEIGNTIWVLLVTCYK